MNSGKNIVSGVMSGLEFGGTSWVQSGLENMGTDQVLISVSACAEAQLTDWWRITISDH